MISLPRAAQRRRDAGIAGQGAWLIGGFGLAQVCAFARNAILGHALSKGDFGVAATLTLTLQIVETLSDLGSDRLIVQAKDGAGRRFMAAAHFVLAARGILLALALLAIGPAMARFFNTPDSAGAFMILALAPLVKGFMHLDFRRAQRRLDNRDFAALEAAPQAAALALTLPMLSYAPNPSIVAWLAVVQGAAAVLLSHALARRPYQLAYDAALLERHVAFGWPILASALPLIAVYQGDRIIVGRTLGMDQLAAFTAAFLATMAPGVIAAKTGQAMMLPLFSAARRRSEPIAPAFGAMTDIAVFGAALYLALFAVAGERLLPLVFGPNYRGLGPLVTCLAAMWTLRMIQAGPGMALMAAGRTRPLLVAGVIRAGALPFAAIAASRGADIATLAAIGVVFEALSLTYVAARVDALERGLGSAFLARAAFLIPAGAFAALMHEGAAPGAAATALATALAIVTIAAAGIGVLPSLRSRVRSLTAPAPTRPRPALE